MKRWKKWIWTASIGMVLLSTGGCSQGIPIISESKVSQGYTDAQNMLIIATERNRYEDIYTEQIWDVKVDDEGNTFQSYLLQEIQTFLKELKTMNLLADEYEIVLESQEKEKLEELTDQFYESLTQADLDYTGVVRDDVYTMYEAYHRANLLIDAVTKDTNLEISDSEAKVMTIQEIQLSDADTAIAVHEQVNGEKADFMAIAKNVSQDAVIEKSIGRGEHPSAYEDEVFTLENGQISPVIEAGDTFYIVKCIRDFEEDAVMERKEKLALQRKNQAFQSVYETFAAEHEAEIGGAFWDKMTFEQEASTTTDFFKMYQEMWEQ